MKPYLKISPTRALHFSSIILPTKRFQFLYTMENRSLNRMSFLNTLMRHGRKLPCCLKTLTRKPWPASGPNLVMIKVFTSIFWGVFVKEGKEQEEAMVEAMENLQFLEEELRGKKFFGGERIGFVDLALGWLANLISILEDVAGLKIVGEDKFPLLSTWMKDFADSPIIKDNWPPRDKMIAKFQALRDAKLAAAASK
ncbi:probable glutathione S-transferase isoform X1 [Vitis vinifera]|uniref:probable glutathione S-transferase isoform X1 n=1 Tax=Vitis vinifera TaxID=29760 RepID=UPI00288317D2|nr:probable glutathione S-transferase isoform X1 [Vitis vinifera]